DLKLLDPKAPPRKEQPAPGAAPAAVSAPTVDPLMNEAHFPGPITQPLPEHAHTAVAHLDDDLDDQEVILSAPVERIELPTQVKVPDIPPPPKDERKEPSWNDDDWGFIADPRSPGAWKKSPFYVGIFSIFVDLQMLLRLVVYSIGLAVVLSFVARGAMLAEPGTTL